MEIRKWLVIIYNSELNYPDIDSLVNTRIKTDTEHPTIIDGTLIIKITNTYLANDMFGTNKYDIFKSQSIYEIPEIEIKSKEDLYDIYKDAEHNLFVNLNKEERNKQIPLTTIPDLSPNSIHQEQIDLIYYHILNK